jgi:two-component system LytT family response regulator
MAPHRVLVVDDERPARAKVARLLAADLRFELAGEAEDGIGALLQIEALKPDLVILDVQMPGITGFEVLDSLGPDRDFAVIFSTAHQEHALRAFDAHAMDYLLKPYDGARFSRALDKAHAQLLAGRPDGKSLEGLLRTAAVDAAARQRMVVKTDKGWVPIALDEIVRVSAAGKHVCIFTAGAKHVVRQGLGILASRLDPARFLKVHRSEIVNVQAVVRVEPWTHGDAILVLPDGSAVVLTRTYRKAFLERFQGRGVST